MYNWRKITEEQRNELLKLRKSQEVPWHSPPHIKGDKTRFIITSACYEHKNIIGYSHERISFFEDEMVAFFKKNSNELNAWVVLPNHYHVLLRTNEILPLLKSIHQFHGGRSFYWNGEEDKRGRRIWCNTLERAIKSDRHFWATVNYIHHNPVKHGYVDKWTDWPYSSSEEYLEQTGREQALRNWKEYNIGDMGNNWDEFEEHAEAVNSNKKQAFPAKLPEYSNGLTGKVRVKYD